MNGPNVRARELGDNHLLGFKSIRLQCTSARW